jgi:hypothetical protein
VRAVAVRTDVILFVTTFFASAVEAVEALTIALAVGVVRGWRSTSGKLRLPRTEDDQRRVLALTTFLDARERRQPERPSTIR